MNKTNTAGKSAENLGDFKDEIMKSFEGENFESESTRVSRYNDYRLIDKYIPEISTAIDVFANSIQSPDDTSKLSMDIEYNGGEGLSPDQIETFNDRMEDITEEYELESQISESIRDGLLLGDSFFIVKSMKDEMVSILSESKDDPLFDNDNKSDYTYNVNESFINETIQGNKVFNEFADAYSKYVTKGNKDTDSSKIKENINEGIRESINKNVVFFENPMDMISDMGKYRKSKSLQNMKPEELKFTDKAFVKRVEPEDMVKLEIDGLCIGYIYIEPDSGADIKGAANPVLSAMTSMLGNGYDRPGQQSPSMGVHDSYV